MGAGLRVHGLARKPQKDCEVFTHRAPAPLPPAGGRRVAQMVERNAKQLLEATPEQEFEAKVDETDFAAAMCALAILRCVTLNEEREVRRRSVLW